MGQIDISGLREEEEGMTEMLFMKAHPLLVQSSRDVFAGRDTQSVYSHVQSDDELH